MIHNVFSLHTITAGEDVQFPIPIQDYQHYIFGSDRLAHRFGTDLATAFVASTQDVGCDGASTSSSLASPSPPPPPSSSPTTSIRTSSNSGLFSNEYVVAVLSNNNVPTATHRLQTHFVARLNQELSAVNAKPATAIHLSLPQHARRGGNDALSSRADAVGVAAIVPTPARGRERSRREEQKEEIPQPYPIDLLRSKAIIVLSDLRTSSSSTQEDQIIRSLFPPLSSLPLPNTNPSIIFAYIVHFTSPPPTPSCSSSLSLSHLLTRIISPSLADITCLFSSADYILNASAVHWLLGREYAEFCQLVRRQDDGFVRLLIAYGEGERRNSKEEEEEAEEQDEGIQRNLAFLKWELETRQSV